MSQCVYQTEFEPDPNNAVDVLAFVLCPERAFVEGGDEDDLSEVRRIICPAKAQALRDRYQRNVSN